jgi:hypothetical protein
LESSINIMYLVSVIRMPVFNNEKKEIVLP